MSDETTTPESEEADAAPGAELTVYEVPASSELEQWARDLRRAYSAAVSLVRTSFVPATYQGKPEEAAAAIMTGQELGLSPLASLRSIDIIQGVPALRAIALRALVQSHGHKIWVVESTKTRAIVKAQRKGTGEVETSEWTIERARDLKLLGKTNWTTQPIAMLLARATSEVARLVDADGLLGIPYSVEELEDDNADQAPSDAKPKRPTTRAARAPLTLVEPAIPDAALNEAASVPVVAEEPEPEMPEDLIAQQEAEHQAEASARAAAAFADEGTPAVLVDEPTPEELI